MPPVTPSGSHRPLRLDDDGPEFPLNGMAAAGGLSTEPPRTMARARFEAAAKGHPTGDFPPYIERARRRDGLDYALAAATALYAGEPDRDVHDDLMAFALGVDGLSFEEAEARVMKARADAKSAPSSAVALQRAGGRPGLFTAHDLVQMDIPAPKWIVPGVLPEGHTLLAGKPKFGKSFLSLGLAFALASGGRALGKVQVAQCDALYLFLEGGMAGLRSRLVALCDGKDAGADALLRSAPAGLAFATDWPRGTDGLDALDRYLSDNRRCKFVVIDTLQHFRTPEDGRTSGSRYQEEYEATTGITRVLTYHRASGVTVHHASKRAHDGGGDVLDLISGSTGLVAGVDNGAVLTNTPTGAVLAVVPRELEGVELAMRRFPHDHAQSGHWELLGDAAEEAASGQQKVILDKLREAGELTVKEIWQLTDIQEPSARKQLHRMAGKGIVEQRHGKWALVRSAAAPVGEEADAPEITDDEPF